MHMNAINQFLIDTNTTQTEFGKKINVGQSMVRQWATGTRPVSLDRALKIEEVFGIDAEKSIKHTSQVFTYEGEPVGRANNHAWRKALKRAGIVDFRWHDLRHTWASWHIKNGTPLHILKELGGRADLTMVLRYAHLSSDHLQEYAENTKSTGGKVVSITSGEGEIWDKFTTRHKKGLRW